MNDKENFSLEGLLPLLYLVVIVYGIAAFILVPFGLPIFRNQELPSLLVAVFGSALCVMALHFALHSERSNSISPAVRKTLLFSSSVILLSQISYIVTTAYFSIKPAINVLNGSDYDPAIARFESWLFDGTLPSLWLIERIDGWQLIVMDASYHLFMPFLAFSLMIAVYTKGLRGGIQLSIAQFIGLFVCLLVSLVFPSQGPLFLYPETFLPKLAALPSGQLAQHLLLSVNQYAHDPYGVPLVAGIAAMPSYHVFSWAIGLAYWRYLPRPALVIGLMACALNWLCTVVLGWHYVLDGAVSLLLVVPIWKTSDAFIRLAMQITLLPRRPVPLLETLPCGATQPTYQTPPPPPCRMSDGKGKVSAEGSGESVNGWSGNSSGEWAASRRFSGMP